MTPEQQQIVALIRSSDLDESANDTTQADRWQNIAVWLNTRGKQIVDPSLISMATTIAALGSDAEAVINAFELSGVGRQGLAKLASDGLHYAHPITQTLLSQMVAADQITPQIKATLTGLSVRTVSLAEDVGLPELSPEDVQAAWEAQALSDRVDEIKKRIDAIYNEANSGSADAVATLNSVADEVA